MSQSPSRPLWRRGFNVAERTVGSRLEEVVSMRTFNDFVVVAFRGQRAARRMVDRRIGSMVHLWNLPTRSDVKRLQRQIGILTAELREMSEQLQDERHRAAAPAAAPRPAPAGNRRRAASDRHPVSDEGRQ